MLMMTVVMVTAVTVEHDEMPVQLIRLSVLNVKL